MSDVCSVYAINLLKKLIDEPPIKPVETSEIYEGLMNYLSEHRVRNELSFINELFNYINDRGLITTSNDDNPLYTTMDLILKRERMNDFTLTPLPIKPKNY